MRIRSSLSVAGLALALSASLVACSLDVPSTSSSSTATEPLQGSSADGGPVPGGPFPAFTPPAPQLTLHGGSVLSAPKFQLVRYASDHNTVARTLIERLGASSYWQETTSEYGVGPATALREVALSAAAPAQIDDTDIQAWLLSQLDEKNTAGLAAPDAETVYVWMPPATTTIISGGDKLCKGVGGYHNTVTRKNGQLVPYIVVPQCSRIGGSLLGADALTFALSHEMIETATDPFPDTGYVVSGALDYASHGGEVGDLCELTTNNSVRPADLGVLVQRTWSNRAAAAGHEPCVPAAGLVTFGAFAEQPDRHGSQRAIKIVKGERTIQLQLYSDAPMGEFKVTARDLADSRGEKTELALNFPDGSNTATGKNGDILELTVKPVAPGTFGGASVLLVEAASSDGKSLHQWVTFVAH